MTSRKFESSLSSKLMIYEKITKPNWTCGVALWGTVAKNYVEKMVSFRVVILRTVIDKPWDVRNDDIRKDKEILTVKKKFTMKKELQIILTN